MRWGDRRSNAWASLAAAVAVCLAVALSAYFLAGYSWGQIVNYSSPFVSSKVPADLASTAGTRGPVLARRVVLVIVDGLREDVSRSSMPALNALRTDGSDLALTVPQPSLSFPNWTTILTGASPTISGVTTNWHTGREYAPTLVDMARASGRNVVVSGPTDFTDLFGFQPGRGVALQAWPGQSDYVTAGIVDDALRLSKETSPALVVVHLPDLDVAGHQWGGASEHYRSVAAQIDTDIGRLVLGMQDGGTTFVVTADHGHTDVGGHGGWETSVLQVPGVFSGAGIRVGGKGAGDLAQVAPTVSALLGLNDPAFAESRALRSVISTANPAVLAADNAHHVAYDVHYVGVVRGVWATADQLASGGGSDAVAAATRDARLAAERNGRLPTSIAILLGVILAVAVVFSASWRAGAAALAGTVAYYLVYELLYFVVHGYAWSLSAFNTETYVKSFMNGRMVDAFVAALIAAAVAGYVYPLLRRDPKGPQVAEFLPGYLTLGPVTLLFVLGTLALQVGWFLWRWGASVTWVLPDLRAGFKYDLDLVQMTAVGLAALIAPLVTYALGRYHPKVM